MKRFPKYLAGAAGVVALGWIVPAIGQQPNAPRLNPGLSVPPAAAPAPVFPGPASPVPGSAAPGSYAPNNAARPAQRGMVMVPHALVTAIDDVKVPARDAGTLTKRNVKGGELVNVDFVLGEIDSRDTLAKQRIAQGEYDASLAQYNSKAEIEAAKKGYEVANAEWEQAKDIRAKNPGAISIQEYRRAEFQAQRAWAQIQVAETDNLVAGLTSKMKKAQLDATDIELSKKKIEAPIQGQIVEVYKHMGEWVQPGDPVFRLVRLDKVRVEGFVYAAEAGRNDIEGKPVSVTVKLPGEKETTVNGRVDFVSPIIEGSGRNRQYRIWAEVENQFVDGNFVIQPGASAEMTINTLAAKLPAAAAEAAPALNGFGGARSEAPATETPAVETLKPVVDEMPAPAAPMTPAAAPMAPAATPMATPMAPAATPMATPMAPAATPVTSAPAVRPMATPVTQAAAPMPAARPATQPNNTTAPRANPAPRPTQPR
ncbi:efflux RND transporter periplasmic adaptor subunit [Anatilimnocola floriformis]|uniref:efflux RND transporter periplasmic adaptor subunit n=1 Tax=Anatilimnocola floriformis TaxID=2948575 RepID=UPI0020C555E6|nr:HlyD family efflux transporter periplasmic adaptor subunit [Anatilimnocola floriformis]